MTWYGPVPAAGPGPRAARPPPAAPVAIAALAALARAWHLGGRARLGSHREQAAGDLIGVAHLGERAQLELEPPERVRLHPAGAAGGQVGIGPVKLRAAELAVDERGQQVSEVTHRSRTRRSLSRCARAARS